MRRSKKDHGLYDTIDQVVTDGVSRGLAHLQTQDDSMNGRTVKLSGRDVLNFGTASYMHLERHPALVEGARDALDRYGTQFSASRAYLSLGLYEELEDNLSTIFGKPVLAAASTTLGHLSAIPVLVGDRDAIILDQQVHSSMQTVVQIPKSRGVPIQMIRHNRMDQLEERIQRLRGSHRTIWYFADGIYSMFGDGAPMLALHELMNRYPQLRVYMDDAHGFGWTGKHGCGWARSRVPHHDQLILAVSLNKSYASAGGALVFANEADKQRVRNCGPTFIFCGPIQPPMLGACIAATRLHLSDEIVGLQAELGERIRYCREGLDARGIPQIEPNDSPLYFVPTGLPRLVIEVAQRLLADNCLVNLGIFPAVPMSTGGVRFHMHRGLAFADIDDFLDKLAFHYKSVLTEEGITPQHLVRAFRLPHLAEVDLSIPSASPIRTSQAALQVHHHRSLAHVPADLWDRCFGGQGPMSHSALRTMAPAFADAAGRAAAPCQYVWVTDENDRVVLATFFCTTQVKEDMFSSAEISEKVEDLRKTEGEGFLVSKGIVLGCPVSLGRHLWLNRDSAAWQQALKMLVDVLIQEKEAANATRILLREFESGADDELRDVLLDLGFVEASMPSMMTLEQLDWEDRDGYLASMKGRYRYEVRKEIFPHLDRIRVDASPVDEPAEIESCYALYQKVHARGRQLNVIAMPLNVFSDMVCGEEFDVLRFYLQTEGPETLGAVMLSHYRDGRYTALVVGFDQKHVASHGIYKASLFLTVERAKALGAESVNLAFTADVVKRKVGAKPIPTCAYALIDDTFDAGVLMNL